jgi:hypothetical protein
MGVPEWHYIRALQNLAHALAYTESAKKARQLNEEPSEEVLKQFIFEKKAEVSEKEFYYLAGRATQCTIDEAYDMGCEDYFYSGAVCFIEWPEMVEDLLPGNTVWVDIKEEADGSRSVVIAE